jgi:integrase
MTSNSESTIARLVDRCEAREGISDADAEAILEAHRTMELLGRNTVSVAHYADVLMRMCKLATEVGGLADALTERAAAEPLVRYINRTYENPETNKGYRTALRSFGRFATGGGDVPESLAWVPGGYPANYDPAPDPAKMFEWTAHIEPMLDACRNVRDEALIALAWDLGPRTSELAALTVGNISDSEYGLAVTIENGKTGSRSPTIVKAVPYVNDWLNRHPGGSDDPLWSRLSTPAAVSNNYLRKILREAGDRAAVELPAKPTPTRMRKSSASFLAKQGVNQPYLEDHHGWARGSSEASRYIATFGDAGDRAIAEAHGMEVEHEDDGPAYIECVRCTLENDVSRDRCRRCGQALTQSGAETAAQLEEMRAEMLMLMDSDQTGDPVTATDTLTDPEVEHELTELRGKLDRLEAALGDYD